MVESRRRGTQLAVVIGNIGSGKTSLCDELPHRFDFAAVLPEPVQEWRESGMLATLYEDLDRRERGDPPLAGVGDSFPYAFQTYVVATRLATYRRTDWDAIPDGGVVLADGHVTSDRHIYVQNFANQGAITDLQMRWYAQHFDLWTEIAPECLPAVYVYLRTPVATCAQRIAVRDRSEESTVVPDYLYALDKLCESLVQRLKDEGGRVIEIDGSASAEDVARCAADALGREFSRTT